MPLDPNDHTMHRCDGCQSTHGGTPSSPNGTCMLLLNDGRTICYPGCSGNPVSPGDPRVLSIGENQHPRRAGTCTHFGSTTCSEHRNVLINKTLVKIHEGSFLARKDFNKPEPHDSCPMFVGAWGVNHTADCAWVKWNHARLVAKTEPEALGKQNKTSPA